MNDDFLNPDMDEKDKAQKKREEEAKRLQELSKLDQSMQTLVTHFPPLWRQLYLRLVDEGFTEAQAIELLKAYIHSTNGLRTN